MTKIQMTTPLVEMDGDEMTRILWKMIKDELLLPYIDLNTEYYDLGLAHRNDTDDQVTIDAAEATKKYGVAVKCATITPNHARMDEYDLKKMYKSPNGTIRAILDGTVFRAPIVVKGIEPCVRNWKKPITLARHAYGDIYKNTEMYIDKPGKVELVYTSEDGEEKRALVQDFKAPGVAMGMHNMEASIESFARSCFNYALDTKQDVWFGAKDTISKTYDAAHGTVQRHYYRHLEGGETSTNSVATIFAWTGALRKRGELDGNAELAQFADKLEKATLTTIESGKMTKDLALITTIENPTVLNSEGFILAIRETLDTLLK